MNSLPQLTPRGPISDRLLSALSGSPAPLAELPAIVEDPLDGEDFQLALYACYELHYRGLDGVDERWEWDPGMLAFRAHLEHAFEARLDEEIPAGDPVRAADVPALLRSLTEADDGPSLSRFIETRATLDQLREFLIQRSPYQLKEADPHSWAIPRLSGAPKAALVEIQADEYGGGAPDRIHATLFANTMRALDLDASYGAYVDEVPGVTLATVNLVSLLGLHRRRRGAVIGHLAAYEMSSALPSRRYGNGLRRLGFTSADAVEFFDEHVEADSVHENIAAYDLAGGLATQEPALAGDIVWGARSLAEVERRFAEHVLGAWGKSRSSLRSREPAPVAA